MNMNEVCFIISEVVQISALSACAEHKTLFMNQIWPDGVFTPTYLSYAFPDLVCARRDRDDITLVAHTSSGRPLLLEGRNITIVFLAQHSVAYSAVRRTMNLALNESRTENYSRDSHK